MTVTRHCVNIRFGFIKPPGGMDAALFVPKTAGHPLLQHEEGFVVPCLVRVESALSCTKASATHDMGHQGGLHRGTRDRAVQRPR
ncbi:hypothetical protein [Streptomyces mirabilis]|uniref:hypothetical protein n=1 Tax=Streptomyces mirabilis TaxID=68239 RepID=UPI00325079B1